MDRKDAINILANGKMLKGKINDMKIIVFPSNVSENFNLNNFELNMEFIQDFVGIDDDGNYFMIQGHSLSDIEVE